MSISGMIGSESLEKLIKCYNELKEKEVLEIYLNSEGGDPNFAVAIIDIINENKDYIEIIAHGDMMSAAFDIFFRSECTRYILKGTIGMVHLSRIEGVEINGGSNVELSTNKKWMTNDKKERLNIYESIGLTKTELAKIKKGSDVYLHYERLIELLQNQQLKVGESNYYIS